MFNDKFTETISHEGAVAIVTCDGKEAHVTNTWNSYVHINGTNQLLIPAAGMHSTEEDTAKNNKVKITFGSKEVQGTQGMGAGFYLEGKAAFKEEGKEFDMMKEKFPWLRKVLIVTVELVKQTI